MKNGPFDFIFRNTSNCAPTSLVPLQADEDGNVDLVPADVVLRREIRRSPLAAFGLLTQRQLAADDLYNACNAALAVLPLGPVLDKVIAALERADGIS